MCIYIYIYIYIYIHTAFGVSLKVTNIKVNKKLGCVYDFIQQIRDNIQQYVFHTNDTATLQLLIELCIKHKIFFGLMSAVSQEMH